MATETITIQVDPEAARAYHDAPPADQKKMRALLRIWLRDVATSGPATLREIMSDCQQEGKGARAHA